MFGAENPRASDSAPYFSHAFTADDLWNLNHNFNRFYGLVLTKSDGPVQITLNWVQSESASSTAGPQCTYQTSMVVRPVRPPPPRIIRFSGVNPVTPGAVERKPRDIVYTGDGAALLAGNRTVTSHLHWATWNRHIGRATGADWHDNCIPDCARGTYSAYPITLRAYRPRFIEGYLVFTRVTVTYTGPLPPYPAYRRGWLTYRLHWEPQNFEAFWK